MMEKNTFLKFISFDPKHPSKAAEYFWEYRDRTIKMNWSALLFGSFWFLYRRMYLMFILVYFGMGYALTYGFMALGYDRGASGAYGSMIDNVLVAVIGHALYLRFVKNKIEKTEHLGTHVRLFLPLAMLMRNGLLLMNIQVFGVWVNNDFLIKGIYPFLYIALIHTAIMYVYYFINWMRSRHVA
jgi:hypothetical protein